ncbi:MAG: response regulator [Gemmatimonadaceae bacterium]
MGAHVLIVEDSALVVGALRILLEDAGYRVSSAGSVREALETGRAEVPDVMLLDLTLPDGDGLTVLEGLAATGRVPSVTVAVTGRDEPNVIQRCLEVGCREVLIKPMNALQLPRQIARWLAEPRSAPEP